MSDDDCVGDAAFGFGASDNNRCLSPTAAADFSTVEYRWIFWLSVATAACFVVLAVPRALHLGLCRRRTCAPSILLVAKLLVAISFAGLRLGLLIVAVRRYPQYSTGSLVAATAVEFGASFVVVLLLPLEHFKSCRPSILICLFIFLGFIYDIARCPWLWTSSRRHVADDNTVFAGLFTAATAAELILVVLESVRRRNWVVWEADDHSPEETSGILSLGLYSWLNPLLWRGYHEPLTMQKLYAIDQAISVETIDPSSDAPSEPGGAGVAAGVSTWHLIVWLTKPLGAAVVLPVLPRLCLLGFTFCQPFFIQRLLGFLSSHGSDSSSTASGLVAVAVFTYSGIAISTSLYWYYQERFQSLLRAFLISAVYRKTARVPHVGDGDPAAVTLMGADVERVYTGLRQVHELWANTIQIALAAWLLQRQLGLAFLAPLVVVLLGFASSYVLSHRAVPYQSAWMARVQKRTSFTSTVLGRIKDLRVSGMTSPVTTLVQHEREDEIRVGERSRMVTAVSASLSQLPPAIAPALAFAFGPHALDQTRAYTSLSFLALLAAPLMVVLQSLPIIAACFACLRRIRLYLLQQERVDGRLIEQSTEKPDATAHTEACVAVRNGTFGWTGENAVLKDVNLCLPKSSITFVVGPVASGKSTLCRALLGEVPHAQGSVALRSKKLGYCDQVPFLFNCSIMDNIIGFSSFEPVRYAEVIHATMLAEDLRTLPAGDSTIIGTKGISLSGGQRQRVSLARALYHDAEILVLDDVFSGLDGSTQHRVCQSVFGPDGLLRSRGTTAIICTHSTHFLSVADRVVALSSDGTIAEQGSLAEIMQDEQRARRVGLTPTSDALVTPNTRALGLGTSEIEILPDTMTTTTTRPIDIPLTKPQPKPPVVTRTVDFDVYRRWLSAVGLLPLVLFFLLVVGNGFFSNFPNIWVKLWSADSVSPNPQHSFAYWIGIYALLGVCVVLCVFPAGLVMLRTAVRHAGLDLHQATIETVMHSSLRFLGSTDVGKILNLFSQDMNIMDTQLPRMVNNLSFCLANAVGQAVVIAVSSAWLAISYPFFMALLWAVQRVYLPTSKRLRVLDLEAKTPLYTNFLDTLAGLPTIRAFGWFPHHFARNNELLDDSQRPSYLLAMAQQWLMVTMNIMVAILAILLVALATQLGSSAGNVGAGLVTLITLGNTLTIVVVAYTGLETSLGAISRLKAFGEETEREDGEGTQTVVPAQAWPMGGRVDMQQVEASYDIDGTDKVLKGLTLVIPSKQKIAICGRTGSGKSTILSLILRLIDPLPPIDSTADSHNAILIDETPLGTIDRTTLRERIISASQDAVFLPDGTTFRTNLDPWAAASDAERTAALADFKLDAVIDAKGGLDAPLNSAELSAGQKELFSLARAVLRRRVKLRVTGVDGGLLLLDEVTSSADAETEVEVGRMLEREFGAWTVVMVTHRREMAVGCERVVVVDNGRVVEDGKPGELLEKEGGWFRALWANGGS